MDQIAPGAIHGLAQHGEERFLVERRAGIDGDIISESCPSG